MFSNLKEGTQLMAIYTPYFYIIQDVRNGMYYAGAKWGKDADPVTFMIEGGYTTSSETIEELIRGYGLDIFVIRKIRTFQTGPEAYRYETRFLQKVDARNHSRFYNKHNNDHIFTYHDDKYKEKMFEIYGVDDPNKSPEIVSRMKEANIKNLGVPYPMMSDVCKEKAKQTNIRNLGVENAMHSEEIKEKMRNNNLEKYGVENTFQADWAKEKIKETLIDRYGVEHPMHSEEIKEKLRQTNIEKYGVENTFQSEESKAKIKARMDYLLSRPQLETLRKYQKKYKITFGRGWVRKSDEFINNLLNDLKQQYGEL